MNVQDTLPVLLRLLDDEEMATYNDMSPTTLDYLANYADAVDAMPYTIDVVANSGFAGVFTPGAAEQAATATTVGGQPTSWISYPSNVLAHDMNRGIGHRKSPKSRGSWKIKGIWGDALLTPRELTIADTEAWVQFEVFEPLLLSPFVFGSGAGKQGFYGIQTMNFQMNMAPTANGAWRCAINPIADGALYSKTATIAQFTDSQLLFQFLTPHPSDLVEPRNVVPYYEMPIYRTTSFPLLPGQANNGQMAAGVFPEPAGQVLQSSNI